MTEDIEGPEVRSDRIERRSVYEVGKDFGFPVIVLLFGLVVTYTQYKIEERRIYRQNEIETSRIVRQEKIEKERNQISILNNYRRSISDLIGGTNLKDLRSDARFNKSNHFYQIAMALTKSTLPQLDGSRKGNLIAYLITLDLLREEKGVQGGYAPISLANTDLSQAILKNANLKDADLKNTSFRGAELGGTILSGADLDGADFRGALNLAPLQLMSAMNWQSASLDDAIRVATQKAMAEKEMHK